MGDAAEMMLDGTLCEGCGSYIDDEGGAGFPRYCSPQCAKDRGADAASTDDECRAYLDDLAEGKRHEATMLLRLFMGVGKKRAKRLVAQWRAGSAGAPQ